MGRFVATLADTRNETILLVISPAKALDFTTPAPLPAQRSPRFVAAMLIEHLRALVPQEHVCRHIERDPRLIACSQRQG